MKLPRLREWRTRRGLSQAELAEAAEVERAAVSKYETGKREAHPATARRLADALGTTVEELVYSPGMERPPFGKPHGAALIAAREAGGREEELALLQRFAEEATSASGRSMYESHAAEVEFAQALESLDLSKLPKRSARLVASYIELVGGFVQDGVSIPTGLARSLVESLQREERREGRSR